MKTDWNIVETGALASIIAAAPSVDSISWPGSTASSHFPSNTSSTSSSTSATTSRELKRPVD